MNPFVGAQIQAVVEGIRLLESYVTAPLGLYSDIKMLRESMPYPEAGELSRDETRTRRLASLELTDDPLALALDVVSSIRQALATLQGIRSGDAPPLAEAWLSQGRRVLGRVEARVGGELRASTATRIRGLYVVVAAGSTADRPVAQVTEAALKGGAAAIELRLESETKAEGLSLARDLLRLCESYRALFFVGGEGDLAAAAGSHGLRLGGPDLPVPEARAMLTPRQLVGLSVAAIDEATDSQAQTVDYMVLGPLFAADGSTVASPGLDALTQIKGMLAQPLVAVGGVSAENAGQALRAGADAVGVGRIVTLAENVEEAARRLVDATQQG